MFRILIISLLVWLWSGLTTAGSMVSWKTNLSAPQIMVQDDASGKIFHSYCNSQDSPIYPANESVSLPIPDKALHPKKGTKLGAFGYQEGNSSVVVVQWLTDRNAIGYGLYTCNDTTGLYELKAGGPWVISTSNMSIHPQTALASVVLGMDAGIRVYYQDEDKATATLKYTQDAGWVEGIDVSHDSIQGFELSAAFTDSSRVTVLAPRDEKNIEIATLQSNKTWIISTVPTPLQNVDRIEDKSRLMLPPTNFTNSSSFRLDMEAEVSWSLQGWDGNAQGLGLTLDYQGARNIFYVGNDSLLHHIAENVGVFAPASVEDEDIWPLADGPNAPFAVTYDALAGDIWVYYVSDGNMTQIHRSGEGWQPATTLRKVPDVPQVSSASPGLSNGAKAGIGVGVALGGIAIIALVWYFLIQRRRDGAEKKRTKAEAAAAALAANHPSMSLASQLPVYGSGTSQGQWMDGQWVATTELASSRSEGSWSPGYSHYQPMPTPQPLVEMQVPVYSHEMVIHGGYYEMPTGHHDFKQGPT